MARTGTGAGAGKHTPEELAAAAKVVRWLRANPSVRLNTTGAEFAINLFILGEDDAAYAFLDGMEATGGP